MTGSYEENVAASEHGSAASPPGRAMVTGASSGIGEAFAHRLARHGYDLILVARRQRRLESLANDLRQEHGVQVESLVADLREPGDLRLVEERLAGEPALSLLVNNAGTQESDDAMIRLHIDAPARLTRAALPGMIERNAGDIVNIASIAAFRTTRNARLPYMATYSATKAFIVTYCLRLHDELRGTGVRVQALCPGWVPTEMVGPEDLAEAVPADAWMSADDVVQASLTGLEQGEVICVPGLEDPHLLDELNRIKNAITARAGTSGVLASRYRET